MEIRYLKKRVVNNSMEMLAIASTRSGDYLKSTSSSLMGSFISGPKILARMREWWYGDHIDIEYIINNLNPPLYFPSNMQFKQDMEDIYDEYEESISMIIENDTNIVGEALDAIEEYKMGLGKTFETKENLLNHLQNL